MPSKDEWGYLDPGHNSGKIDREYNSDFAPYAVGGNMPRNSGPEFSELVLSAWNHSSENQSADAIKAAAMRKLTSSQMVKRNEQKSATAYGAKQVPNGPGF